MPHFTLPLGSHGSCAYGNGYVPPRSSRVGSDCSTVCNTQRNSFTRSVHAESSPGTDCYLPTDGQTLAGSRCGRPAPVPGFAAAGQPRHCGPVRRGGGWSGFLADGQAAGGRVSERRYCCISQFTVPRNSCCHLDPPPPAFTTSAPTHSHICPPHLTTTRIPTLTSNNPHHNRG